MAKQLNQSDPFDDDWGLDGEPAAVTGDMPAPNTATRAPFIKPYDVGGVNTKGTLELVRVTGETTDYSDVILAITHNGKEYRLGMRTFSKEYQSLAAKFGTKRADWHGTLRFKVVENNGKPYVSVRA